MARTKRGAMTITTTKRDIFPVDPEVGAGSRSVCYACQLKKKSDSKCTHIHQVLIKWENSRKGTRYDIPLCKACNENPDIYNEIEMMYNIKVVL